MLVSYSMTDSRQLSEKVYAELHALASREMKGERRNHTLQPTALVSEAYLRMAQYGETLWSSPARFRAVAATCIRRVLIEHARRRAALKRGGGLLSVSLAEVPEDELGAREMDVLELEDVLEELEQRDPELARLIELRYFGGLTVAECAEELGATVDALKDRSRFALAWLRMRLRPSQEE